MVLCALIAPSACGETQGPAAAVAGPEAASAGDDDDADLAGLEVHGITGSLGEREVQQAMEAQMDGFLSCFSRRVARLRALSGRLELAYRVKRDGRVRWVYPRFSNLGDRETERCMIDAAAAVRFPAPSGHAEAEFTHPLELELLDGVPAPEPVDVEAVEQLVAKHGRDLLSECRPHDQSYALHLTAYVDARGKVIAVGASADDLKAGETLDCAARAVRSWPLPRAGKRLSKVEFALR